MVFNLVARTLLLLSAATAVLADSNLPPEEPKKQEKCYALAISGGGCKAAY